MKVHGRYASGFILERGFAGFPQIGKNAAQNLRCRIKWGVKKKKKKNIDPRISYYFLEIKHSKTTLTTALT